MDLTKSVVVTQRPPFVLQFYSEPSHYFWTHESGDTHVIHQGEGGEKGDALMPMLTLMTCPSCACQIALGPIYKHLQEALDQNARIQLGVGKIQVWNRGGHFPPGCQEMQEAAARVDPQARVWRGGEQGVRVLSIPIGHEEFVHAELRATTEKHRSLVERISLVRDLQSAWLLLLFCANTRVTYSAESCQLRHSSLQPLTMLPHGSVSRSFWGSLVVHRRRRMIVPVCHSRGVGAVCEAPPERGSQHTRPAGPPRSCRDHGEVFVWSDRHATLQRRCVVLR